MSPHAKSRVCEIVCVLHYTEPKGTFNTVQEETLAHCCIDTPGPHKRLHAIPFHFHFLLRAAPSNEAETP